MKIFEKLHCLVVSALLAAAGIYFFFVFGFSVAGLLAFTWCTGCGVFILNLIWESPDNLPPSH